LSGLPVENNTNYDKRAQERKKKYFVFHFKTCECQQKSSGYCIRKSQVFEYRTEMDQLLFVLLERTGSIE